MESTEPVAAPSEARHRAPGETAPLTAQELLAMIGYGLFVTCFFLGAFELLPSLAAATGEESAYLGLLLAWFGGMLAFNVMCTYLPIALLARGERVIAVATALLGAGLPLAAGIALWVGQAALPLVAALSLAAGLATSAFYYLWDNLSLRKPAIGSLRLPCAALASGCLLFLVVRAMVLPQFQALLCAAFALASFGLLACLRATTQEPDDAYFAERAEADGDRQLTAMRERPPEAELKRQIRLAFFLFGIAFGIAWAMLADREPLSLAPAFALMVVAAALLGLVARRHHVVRDRFVTTLMSVCILVIGVCFLMAIVLPGAVAVLFICAICAFWQAFWVVDTALLLHHAAESAFSILKHTSTGRLSSTGGFFLGLACAAGAIAAVGYDAALVALFSAMVVTCIACSITLLPRSKEEPSQGSEGGASPLPAAHRGQASGWEEVCASLSAAYRLSPREGEVLERMACGLNNRAISEQLVLSEHTVKSHVYSIYQKLGIHSRQEMFDALERFASSR